MLFRKSPPLACHAACSASRRAASICFIKHVRRGGNEGMKARMPRRAVRARVGIEVDDLRDCDVACSVSGLRCDVEFICAFFSSTRAKRTIARRYYAGLMLWPANDGGELRCLPSCRRLRDAASLKWRAE